MSSEYIQLVSRTDCSPATWTFGAPVPMRNGVGKQASIKLNNRAVQVVLPRCRVPFGVRPQKNNPEKMLMYLSIEDPEIVAWAQLVDEAVIRYLVDCSSLFFGKTRSEATIRENHRTLLYRNAAKPEYPPCWCPAIKEPNYEDRTPTPDIRVLVNPSDPNDTRFFQGTLGDISPNDEVIPFLSLYMVWSSAGTGVGVSVNRVIVFQNKVSNDLVQLNGEKMQCVSRPLGPMADKSDGSGESSDTPY